MILRKIEIANFKGIKKTAIELKPITLLFGPNSAGKSSIVQAIHYAREIFLRRNFDPSHTMTGGSAIDFGRYSTLVHNHNISENVTLKFDLNLENMDLPGAQEIEEPNVIQNDNEEDIIDKYIPKEYNLGEFSILCKSAAVSVTVGYNDTLGYARATKAEFTLNNMAFSTIELDDTNPKDIHAYYSNINAGHPALKEFISDETLAGFFHSVLIGEAPFKGRLYNFSSVLTLGNEKYIADGADILINHPVKFFEDMEELFSFLDFIGKVNCSVLSLIREELEKFSYLGPIREIPARNYTPVFPLEQSRWYNGLAAWDEMYTDSAPLELINGWLKNLNTGYTIKKEIYKEVDIQDLSVLHKTFDFTNIYKLLINAYHSSIGDNAIKNDFTTEIIETFKTLDREEIFKRISLLHKKKKIFLKDEQGIEVLPMDIGVGISQVFPVVVAAILQKTSMLAIEQPELHIHPAVQVELGDLFIERITQNPDACFLLETHSEHIILRLLRRIEETGKKKDIKYKLTPDKLNVYWCEPGKDGLKAKRLPVDKTGEFTERWPKGFFGERAEELFPDE